MDENYELPPHDLKVEEEVLGYMLLEKENALSLAPKLCDGDFYIAPHMIIFSFIDRLVLRVKDCSIVLLAEYLDRANMLRWVGGESYLLQLIEAAPKDDKTANALVHILKAYTRIRKAIETHDDTATDADRAKHNPQNGEGRV